MLWLVFGYRNHLYGQVVFGLLMGDFNMCVDASQSTLQHLTIDDPAQIACVSLAMDVYHGLDVLKLMYGCGYMGLIQVLLSNLPQHQHN